VAFERYLAALIADRRAQPRDDLLTDLLAIETPELISLLLTLIFGGHETTANLIGNALVRLLVHPAPVEVDALVEETLRADAPVQGSFRKVVADTELSGVRLPAGAQVFAVIGSAHHDPAAPASDRHLAFGRGIHFCVGATLARLEARTAVGTLMRRLPGLRFADGFVPPYVAHLLHRGPARLAAVWDS
jgi:cytochrome P450